MTILYAGPKAIFDENVALLRVLGGNAVYCGEPIGAAAALDLALLDLFFGVSAALLHGAALCAAESVPLNEFFGRVPAWLSGVPAAAIEGVGTGTYPHGNSTMVTNAAAIRHIVRGSEGAGIDASFPSALLGWFTRAIDRGHREDDIPSLYEAFRRP
jgi:3-hydroxyisobutyrate dehydrogenase-like beta-hydroxyacid dehydrogenase